MQIRFQDALDGRRHKSHFSLELQDLRLLAMPTRSARVRASSPFTSPTARYLEGPQITGQRLTSCDGASQVEVQLAWRFSRSGRSYRHSGDLYPQPSKWLLVGTIAWPPFRLRVAASPSRTNLTAELDQKRPIPGDCPR